MAAPLIGLEIAGRAPRPSSRPSWRDAECRSLPPPTDQPERQSINDAATGHRGSKLITISSLTEAYAVFQKIDTSREGVIDRRELQKFLEIQRVDLIDDEELDSSTTIDFPEFLKIWTGIVNRERFREEAGELRQPALLRTRNVMGERIWVAQPVVKRCGGEFDDCFACMRRAFPPNPDFGFSRNGQFLFAFAYVVACAIGATCLELADYKVWTHTVYDFVTSWLMGSLLGRVLSQAVCAYPWNTANGYTSVVRLFIAIVFCTFNMTLAVQLFNVSGYMCNTFYAMIVMGTAKDLPLLERCLDWAAVAVAVGVRHFGMLDCDESERHEKMQFDEVSGKEKLMRCNGFENVGQTRIPIIVGIAQAITHVVIIEQFIVKMYLRSKYNRYIAEQLNLPEQHRTALPATFQGTVVTPQGNTEQLHRLESSPTHDLPLPVLDEMRGQ